MAQYGYARRGGESLEDRDRERLYRDDFPRGDTGRELERGYYRRMEESDRGRGLQGGYRGLEEGERLHPGYYREMEEGERGPRLHPGYYREMEEGERGRGLEKGFYRGLEEGERGPRLHPGYYREMEEGERGRGLEEGERGRRGLEDEYYRDQLRRKEDKLLSVADLGETEKFWIARIEVPGVKIDDIELLLKGEQLKIKARRDDTPFSGKDKLEMKEFHWISKESKNKIKRSFLIATTVPQDHVSARIRNGILEILIRKPAEFRKLRGKSWAKEGRSKHEYVTGTSGRTLSPVVYEHVHGKQVFEQRIPHVHPVDVREEHHKVYKPIERVEVHRHIHPQERLQIHEHVHPRERVDVEDYVRPVITTEVHEHLRPEVTRQVHRDVYPDEIVRKERRDIDVGEVERKVVERDLGAGVLGKGEGYGHHHHHHHGEKHRIDLKGGEEEEEETKEVKQKKGAMS